VAVSPTRSPFSIVRRQNFLEGCGTTIDVEQGDQTSSLKIAQSVAHYIFPPTLTHFLNRGIK
jgi:hypothetical protein